MPGHGRSRQGKGGHGRGRQEQGGKSGQCEMHPAYGGLLDKLGLSLEDVKKALGGEKATSKSVQETIVQLLPHALEDAAMSDELRDKGKDLLKKLKKEFD